MIDGAEFDYLLTDDAGPFVARLLVLSRGIDEDGDPFTSCIMLQGPRLADGSWTRPKMHPLEAAIHAQLDRDLDAIWGPT
jgi:hypothetical protein